jgi:hypothetical protein
VELLREHGSEQLVGRRLVAGEYDAVTVRDEFTRLQRRYERQHLDGMRFAATTADRRPHEGKSRPSGDAGPLDFRHQRPGTYRPTLSTDPRLAG